MTDPRALTYGDPMTQPFWTAAAERRLIIQRCSACGVHQFYPRPFCIACGSDQVGWVEAAGTGTVYAATTFHMEFTPEFPTPYTLALVDLDEGPRLMTNLVGGAAAIGQRVRVTWKERPDAPPLPVFELAEPTEAGGESNA